MKDSTKTKRNRDMERDLFAELSEEMEALADARHGKRTLRTDTRTFRTLSSS